MPTAPTTGRSEQGLNQITLGWLTEFNGKSRNLPFAFLLSALKYSAAWFCAFANGRRINCEPMSPQFRAPSTELMHDGSGENGFPIYVALDYITLKG